MRPILCDRCKKDVKISTGRTIIVRNIQKDSLEHKSIDELIQLKQRLDQIFQQAGVRSSVKYEISYDLCSECVSEFEYFMDKNKGKEEEYHGSLEE